MLELIGDYRRPFAVCDDPARSLHTFAGYHDSMELSSVYRLPAACGMLPTAVSKEYLIGGRTRGYALQKGSKRSELLQQLCEKGRAQ
eukprot:5655742-Amphidinium_carterae.1